jgi:hypothetical protein
MTNRPETENRSRMDNTGTQITLSTRPKTKTNKSKTKNAQQIKLKMNKTYSTKKPPQKTNQTNQQKTGASEGKAVPASYNIPATREGHHYKYVEYK